MKNLWKNVAGGAVALLLIALSSSASAQNWVQVQTQGTPPPGRFNNTAVYDPIFDRLIIFGGFNSSICCTATNDVWVLTNVNRRGGARQWIQLMPTGTPPPPLAAASAVYDALSNRMIVYGGEIPSTGNSSGDIWMLKNANGLFGTPSWQMISAAGTAPTPRQNHQAVYDPDSNRMVIVGGLNAVGVTLKLLNDVWVLTNANSITGTPKWQQLNPAAGPSPRHAFAAAYDWLLNRLTIFGGCIDATFSCSITSSELWVLTNATGTGPFGATQTPVWKQLDYTGMAPIAHSEFAVSAYDRDDNQVFLFGGRIGPGGSFGAFTNITWSLSNANGLGGTSHFTMLTPLQSPAPRGQSVSPNLFDPLTDRVIVFGGPATVSLPALNDTWTFDDTH